MNQNQFIAMKRSLYVCRYGYAELKPAEQPEQMYGMLYRSHKDLLFTLDSTQVKHSQPSCWGAAYHINVLLL